MIIISFAASCWAPVCMSLCRSRLMAIGAFVRMPRQENLMKSEHNKSANAKNAVTCKFSYAAFETDCLLVFWCLQLRVHVDHWRYTFTSYVRLKNPVFLGPKVLANAAGQVLQHSLQSCAEVQTLFRPWGITSCTLSPKSEPKQGCLNLKNRRCMKRSYKTYDILMISYDILYIEKIPGQIGRPARYSLTKLTADPSTGLAIGWHTQHG